MREFFAGWRRKTGLLTLVMALVTMAGWVRSFSQRDLVAIKFSSHSSVFVESAEQTIGFGMERANSQPIWEISPAWQTSPSSGVKPLDDDQLVRWSVQWHDFGIGGNHQDYPDYLLLEVHAPYWPIVVPLTLMSLWLLLSMPSKSTQRKIIEPIPVEGA